MWRGLIFCLKAAILVAAAVWLADRPGQVSVEWLGQRIDTSIGMLILAAVVLAAIVALIYRFWRALLGLPGGVGRAMERGRQKRGYKALSHGMVAVAAGDAQEAARYAEKASDLLQDPPLTMLLQAQTAQLQGDEAAAKRYFTAMLDDKETRFLGLRGLMMQAIREGNDASALDYARKAKELRPKTPWLLTTLFELSERQGDLEGAEAALQAAAKAKAIPKLEASSKQAKLLTQRARKAAESDGETAIGLARKAHKLEPEDLPALRTLARLAIEQGRGREAARALEKAWHLQPEPEIARLYLSLRPNDKPLEQMQRLTKLTSRQPSHPESHLVLAEANLKAELWGEARRHLMAVLPDEQPPPAGAELLEVPALPEGAAAVQSANPDGASEEARRVAALRRSRACRLMAQLEEQENGDNDAARRWLERAMSGYDKVAAPRPLFIAEPVEVEPVPKTAEKPTAPTAAPGAGNGTATPASETLPIVPDAVATPDAKAETETKPETPETKEGAVPPPPDRVADSKTAAAS